MFSRWVDFSNTVQYSKFPPVTNPGTSYKKSIRTCSVQPRRSRKTADAPMQKAFLHFIAANSAILGLEIEAHWCALKRPRFVLCPLLKFQRSKKYCKTLLELSTVKSNTRNTNITKATLFSARNQYRKQTPTVKLCSP